MRNNQTLLASLAFGLIALTVQPVTAAAATPSLTGSWQFTLTPGTTTTPPVVQIPGLVTFTTDGSAIETDGSEFVPNPSTTPNSVRTPGHGIWQIGATPSSLYVEYISLELNPDGSLYAKVVTTMILALNSKGNEFSGSYTTVHEIGTVTTSLSSGAVSGQLIPHLALP